MTNSILPAHRWLPEPKLAFHPDRSEDVSAHPLQGLIQFGPYSRSLVNHVLDPIRLAVIAPQGAIPDIRRLMAEIEAEHEPRERRLYLPRFPGFSRVFGLRLVLATGNAHVELPRDLDGRLAGAPKPYIVLADAIVQAISALNNHRSEYDVLAIYLPDRWSAGFSGDEDDFDLHDYLKAITAARGIPTQILREDKALRYPCRCSVMWRLGIALYCKAGGVPWKLAETDPETAYVGLGYAMQVPTVERSRYVTCCSQVFDADGAGLEFIAYEMDRDSVRLDNDNPFLSRSQMRSVMSRSLSLYQRRHAGRAPKRVVVHKSTEFKPDEIDGCFDAWRSVETLELIQVQQDSLWRGILLDAPSRGRGTKGMPANYPCQRGSYVQLGGREVLLWTQGNAPTAVGGRNFYKEGKGIPSPLLLKRFAGHGAWDDGCWSVLGLTKMNWNHDGLYDRLPVTLGYASVLAHTIKRMPELAPRPYEFRFFM